MLSCCITPFRIDAYPYFSKRLLPPPGVYVSFRCVPSVCVYLYEHLWANRQILADILSIIATTLDNSHA